MITEEGEEIPEVLIEILNTVGITNLTINSIDNGSNVISSNEIINFNERFRKIND